MLSTSGGHPDEKALLQGLFINAAPQVAVRMLAPALHLLDRGSGQFNIVMPANIALWSGELPLPPLPPVRPPHSCMPLATVESTLQDGNRAS